MRPLSNRVQVGRLLDGLELRLRLVPQLRVALGVGTPLVRALVQLANWHIKVPRACLGRAGAGGRVQ